MTERLEIKAAVSIDDTGTVTGIAWPFGSADSIGDLIEPTAFRFAGKVPMILEHDQRQVVGVWDSHTVTERGLEVKGRLFVEGIAPARKAREYLLTGKMSGLSIGYSLHDAKARPEGGRTITDLTINEISICRSPVHPDARTTEIKANKGIDLMENEELELTPEVKAEPVIDQKAFNEMKAQINKLEAKANRPRAANVNNPDGENDNSERKAFAEYVRSGSRDEMKALGYTLPSTGNILAPSKTEKTIIEKIAEFSPVRNLASVINMEGALLQLPRLVNVVTPTAVTETGLRPESEPSFEQIELKPFEMSVTVPVTRTLLEDAQINLESYISGHMAKRFAQQEGAWFISGNGTSQAEGVLTSAEVLTTETKTIDADVLIDLFYSIKTGYSVRGAWLMNRTTMAAVRKLKDTDGSYIWQPSIAIGTPPTLLGCPVYEAVDMPNIAVGQSPIVFGDFNAGYTIAERVGLTTMRDEISGADNGIIKLRAYRRVGGRVVLGEALTKLKIKAA